MLDLETRLTDAILDMADELIGGLFAKARNAARRRYAASASDVGRLMRLFHGTIEAMAVAHEGDADAFDAVDAAVGWPKLLRVRDEVQELANLAGEDTLVQAADRWKTLRKFAFRELGGAIRTDFLLRYLGSADLRRTIGAATNKSELFNRYAQWVAFGSSGLATAAERDE